MSDDRSATCPYRKLEASAYWRHAVAGTPPPSIDPVTSVPFTLTAQSRVATAGSCFAQHIARYLQKHGCNYFVAEPAPSFIEPEVAVQFQYGTFSARYGNIYTARQLLQLFDRAYGRFEPLDSAWAAGHRWVDPFRPSVHPEGYRSLAELLADRTQHLARVRHMFESCECFVFTLGLTEAWMDQRDGAVYPVCPGCGYGEFDASRHAFVNFDAAAVQDDLVQFVERLRSVNPAVSIILTVSPVPLLATYSGHHVLSATTYSKSVLRVAAQFITDRFERVCYFPSYEIVTGTAARGAYFAPDLRSVTEDGVRHVMGRFFHHLLPGVQMKVEAGDASPQATKPSLSSAVADLICDEERLVG
ncbi:GSCFA domain-containing protein [Ideonella sp. YS5]